MIASPAPNETVAAPVVVAVSGKLGEFLQGVDPEGTPFLYTATLSSPHSGTTATVTPAAPGPSLRVSTGGPIHQPGGPGGIQLRKTELALRALLARKQIEAPWGFEVRLINSPASAKGLGASSTDMAASLLATARYLGLEVTEQELFSLMCGIERSDFLFQPDAMVCANPLSGKFTLKAELPPLWLVAWDSEPDRTISTEDVAHLDYIRRAYASEYSELASYCDSGDTDALLTAATRSGQINQNLLPKPSFHWALEVAEQNRAGLVVAHSGTFMAFAASQKGYDLDRLAYLEAILLSNGFSPITLQAGRSARHQSEQQEQPTSP